MDKRTLTFVLALSISLFFVNMYFDQQSEETVRQWKQKQEVAKGNTIQKLRKDISERTQKLEALPTLSLKADKSSETVLASGVLSGDAIVSLAWDKDLPQTVYANNKSYTLASQPISIGDVVIYQQSEKDKLLVGELPEFGKYDLQLIDLANSQPSVIFGEYVDGHLEIPLEKLALLEKQSESDYVPKLIEAIVLIKSVDGYLPVAVYRSDTKLMEPLDSLNRIAAYTAKPTKKTLITTNQKVAEKFFVIETPYQQLVFSNYGGALAEINLPFTSKDDKESVVKEIEFDRDMVENHPYNAYFPSHAFFTPGQKEDGDFKENPQGKLGGYYPLMRRDLIEKDKSKSVRMLPRYYSLNIVSEYPETAELVYEVKKFTADTIVFEAVQGHRRITKTFSVSSEAQAPYTIDLAINIEGDSRGLWLTSGIPEVEWISGAPAPTMKYRITRNGKPEVNVIDLPVDSTTVSTLEPDWLCNSNGFLGMILDPTGKTDSGYRVQRVAGTVVPSRLVEIDQQYKRFDAEAMPGYMVLLPLKTAGGNMTFRVFAGPFAESVLKTVDEVYSNSATGYNPDYIACQSFHGWFAFISEPFAKFLFILMKFFHSITGSWGFSIILLTVALRVMLYPLNAWSTKSMAMMQKIAPEVTVIQERNKKDPRKAQIEIMNLYRERGVNPISGCFPLLIQMPFLIGMFDLLKSTFELRGASFIPGWIDNLTAPDVVFSWGYPLPILGTQFHLLPILLGLVMYLQQRVMSTAPKDPAQMTEQQKQQKFMGNIMAVVFTVMFYSFPSGLNIYWLSSMILGMGQQWWTAKQLAAKGAKANVVILDKKKK